ncbi:MAG: Uma2 family endonuclease [Gemmatimonadaceae bacterium]
MAATRYYSADMVRDLINETRHWPRYETVHGELLVTSAPRPWHQEIVGRLYEALRIYARQEPQSHVFMSPADISWGLPDVLVQPDVFVVPFDEARRMDWSAISHLMLAAEVFSPSSLRADRFTKRRLYQEQRVPTYWGIDADAGMVEVWTPDAVTPRLEHTALDWQPLGATTPFTLPLAELFREI